jgi:predicted AAA+ superfamily ATPase
MMEPVKRYLHGQVADDLKVKMVFVGGPRQVGKTTLAMQLLGRNRRGYLNWDIPDDRERILTGRFPPVSFWAFDEIHKYRKWRNLLKGLFDRHGRRKKILVTGSARLDFYRFGGDSLQGRYHFLRLHPLSYAELGLGRDGLEDLLMLGGFPEQFLRASEVESRRWSREYRTRLIREEITGLEQLRDLGSLELLMLRLPELVGSPLSINAVSEDIQVSHKTVMKWLAVFERLYAIFRIPPFSAPKIRAVRKAQKHYHFDWTLVPDLPKRFENLVAFHLLKWVHYEQDRSGRDLELRYFRDIDLREVDFVVLENGKPIHVIEAKWDDEKPVKGLKYLKARFPACEAHQICFRGKSDYVTKDDIRVCPAAAFFKNLV